MWFQNHLCCSERQDEGLLLYVVGRAGNERWQGRLPRNNSQSLSAAGPDIHESVGASKDTRPIISTSLWSPTHIHTHPLCRTSKHCPSSCPSVPMSCSICQNVCVCALAGESHVWSMIKRNLWERGCRFVLLRQNIVIDAGPIVFKRQSTNTHHRTICRHVMEC